MTETAVPSLERAIELLLMLESAPEGLSAQSLMVQTDTPRATLYRILRVLGHYGVVQQAVGGEGLYRLGPTVARWGAQVQTARELIAVAQPLMDALSVEIGETVKLVVRDRLEAVTVAVARSPLDARVASLVGTRLPLHLGVSQRLLLSRAPQSLIQEVLAGPLEKRTSRTLADPARLQASLEQLCERRSAAGQGEGQNGVGAAAALILSLIHI